MRFFILIVILSIGACVDSVPKDQKIAAKETLVKYDKFRGETVVETPLYLSRKGFTDTFPVSIAYRSVFKDNKVRFIQLYVKKVGMGWGFYNSAYGEDGYEFSFVNIDGNVDVGGGLVTTAEYFGLDIIPSQLREMSKEDYKIKVYGKRDSGVFIVPAAFTQGFLEKYECVESRKC